MLLPNTITFSAGQFIPSGAVMKLKTMLMSRFTVLSPALPVLSPDTLYPMLEPRTVLTIARRQAG